LELLTSKLYDEEIFIFFVPQGILIIKEVGKIICMENVIIKKIMIKYGCNKMIKLKRLNKNV
jgi:hypothetical protein